MSRVLDLMAQEGMLVAPGVGDAFPFTFDGNGDLPSPWDGFPA